MKKYLLIIGLLVLSIFAFALPSIDVTENATDNSLKIDMKLMNIELDKLGHMKNVSVVEFKIKKFNTIYEYLNDSFDIIDPETQEEILPDNYSYRIDADEKFIEVSYFYGNTGVKTYRFYNDPNFHFDLELNNLEGYVKIPTISYQPGIRIMDSRMISYIEKLPDTGKKFKALFAIDAPSKIENNLSFYTQGKTNAKIYMGPFKRTFVKETFSENTYNDIKTMLKEVGALGWLSSIFYWFVEFLWWLYNITGNFGWAIIIFTVIIRLVLYPLYHKQTKSMVQMREIQPEVDKLKKKYSNPQKQQEEMMKLYREKGINPAGGCLPALIQLPVFLILWQTIQYFGESFAYNPKFLIWNDLSEGGFVTNLLLIVISLIAYILNALLSSQNSKMAWQSIGMSVIFPIFLANLPAGVFLYYATNASIQVLMTFYNNKRHGIKGISVRELFGLGPKPVRR
ncbi:membrane protein insertase YidC [Oceanotoga sp. DSM 15011]|uniref:Membrane protein insertase YidC n=1 Tax=Oceanotoga teriensis TaxID=515440 RepID=A0AA45HJK4_9BACT|nr:MULTISPECIES: membrane protein insertase YidC [Oceanotoga]MDO7976882.1 membrane protein insertase YidC [Oceanotoga teriensis]PWJ95962.1 YidC/Oxa1 family membrane protein insertase [Oceanotoga teriensis]UYP00815.1 membrane protein insertase YidC [Oceanotoga sp. DSM 15011]